MKVELSAGRNLVGTFMAFDKHMNVVLGDCEEQRRVVMKGKEAKTLKRTLGLVLVRGEYVVSLTVVGPPAASKEARAAKAQQGGPGVARPAGRGIPVASSGAPAPGLAAPARGLGAAAPSQMRPGMGMAPGFAGGYGAAPPMGFLPPGAGGRGVQLPAHMTAGRGMGPGMGRGM